MVPHQYSPRVFFFVVSQALFRAREYCVAYWWFSASSVMMIQKSWILGWFGCVLIGTLTKVQVFGGLREGIGFCISDCSLLCWLVIDLRPLWDRAWLWSLWAMKLVLKILYLIFFFFCLMFSFAYSLVFGNKNFKFKCRSVSLIDN